MPDLIVHRAFGQEVLIAIPNEIKTRMDHSVFLAALEGPDCWSFFLPFRRSGRSKIMHTTHNEEFINALGKFQDICSFSYCSGFICHIVLDRYFHEYIEKLLTEQSGEYVSHSWIERVLDRAEADRVKKPCSVLLRPSAPLPAALLKKLDYVYLEVCGWHHASTYFVVSSWLQSFFLRIFSDSKGILFKLGQLFRSRSIQTLSYYKKEASGPSWEKALTTFDHLRESARDEAVRRIVSLYSSLFGPL